MSMARYRNRRDAAFTVTWTAISRALWAGVFFLAGVLAGQVLL
jgi:membrane protein DedA with SNARE-associated domain